MISSLCAPAGSAFFSRSRYLVFVCLLVDLLGTGRAAGSSATGAFLTWDQSVLRAGSGLMVREWTLTEGLPVAKSLRLDGKEFLRASAKPSTTLPNGKHLVPPFSIAWTEERG